MKNLSKNKKILLIGGGILLVAVAAILFFVLGTKKYTITFNVDGGSKVESIKAKENEIITLPTNVTKEGYIFNGWLDESSKIVNVKYKIVKDVTLKANWISASAETITVTFDSAGGTKVADIIVIKGEELTLPENPTKDGYTFVSWTDSKGTPIYDKALLDSDIALTATWKEVKKETTYTCPSGYTLSGTKCTIEGTVYTTCPSGTHDYNGKCLTVTSASRVNATKVCSTQTVLIDGNGHTAEVQGILVNEGLDNCYYYKLEGTTDSYTCTSQSHAWSSKLSSCYVKRDQNYESSCSDANYAYISNPNDYVTNTGLNGGCYPIQDKTKYCDDGFAYNSSTGKCLKTIDATVR